MEHLKPTRPAVIVDNFLPKDKMTTQNLFLDGGECAVGGGVTVEGVWYYFKSPLGKEYSLVIALQWRVSKEGIT